MKHKEGLGWELMISWKCARYTEVEVDDLGRLVRLKLGQSKGDYKDRVKLSGDSGT